MNYFCHESSFVDKNSVIGKDTKIWHFSHIMSKAKIGPRCNIGQNVVVSPYVVLGENVKVQNNVSIYTGVKTGNDVFIGPSVVFTNVINPRSYVVRKSEYLETIIGDGVSIGANATIVCGITIGKFAFIGAGAVVTKNIKDYSIVYGNPARHMGWMSEAGYKLEFKNGFATCVSGAIYELYNDKVIRNA